MLCETYKKLLELAVVFHSYYKDINTNSLVLQPVRNHFKNDPTAKELLERVKVCMYMASSKHHLLFLLPMKSTFIKPIEPFIRNYACIFPKHIVPSPLSLYLPSH